MTRLSISRAWDETRAFVAGEFRLLAPVALALLALPPVVSAMFAPPPSGSGMPMAGPWMIATLIVFALRVLGLLTISRLALGTPGSLGATLRDVARRLPAALGLVAIVILPAALIATPLLQPLMQSPNNPPPGPAAGLALLLTVMLLLFVRLSLSFASAVSRSGGPIAMARHSIALTRGNFWRLLGAIALLLVTLVVLARVVQAVVGSLVILALGPPEPLTVSRLLLLLAIQLVDTAVVTVLTVLLARVYAQRLVAAGVPSSGT